jgi:hypothetical protein
MAREPMTMAEALDHARGEYLEALNCLLGSTEDTEEKRAIEWERRAYKKLILSRLPGRALMNGHKWKAPKI